MICEPRGWGDEFDPMRSSGTLRAGRSVRPMKETSDVVRMQRDRHAFARPGGRMIGHVTADRPCSVGPTREPSATMQSDDVDLYDLGRRLADIGRAVRSNIIAHRDTAKDSLVAGFQGGDTIYNIDKRTEPIIATALENWPDSLKPLVLIAEGVGQDGLRTFPSLESKPPKLRLLIDPIDGTRSLMYDKRSAWFLAAVACDRGAATRLFDSIASAVVELPTSKQNAADVYIFDKSSGLVAARESLSGGSSTPLAVQPSRAQSLLHGFGQVSNFFPGTKQVASELMERISHATLGAVQIGQATIFDDQYISSGGQMVELMMGRDRFCCDLRPLLYRIIERRTGATVDRGLQCHPYDIAGLAAAYKAGVILTDGLGAPLDAPMDVSTPVHWCGYANAALQRSIEPVIQDWLRENLG